LISRKVDTHIEYKGKTGKMKRGVSLRKQAEENKGKKVDSRGLNREERAILTRIKYMGFL